MEKKKVLFSPIGNTDPVKYDPKTGSITDGSLRYIVRNYPIYAVRMFFTNDIAENAKKDKDNEAYGIDRYTDGIKRIKPDCIVDDPVKTEITEPHKYSAIDKDLPDAIRKCREDYPLDEYDIIFNLASGTPAMKAIMAIMSLELPGCYPVQVENPNFKDKTDAKSLVPPPTYENGKIPDFDFEWLNDDYISYKSTIRHEEPKLAFLRNIAEKNRIISLINAKEYELAYSLAKDPATTLSADTKFLLEFGKMRSKMQLDKAKKQFEYLKTRNLLTETNMFPFSENEDTEKLFEYFMVMEINKDNGDYAELLTKITPFMTELLLIHVQESFTYKDRPFNFIKECCTTDDSYADNIRHKIHKDKMDRIHPDFSKQLDNLFGYRGFKNESEVGFFNLYKICSTDFMKKLSKANEHLISLLAEKIKSPIDTKAMPLADRVNWLRNTVAHHIIDVSEQKFVERTSITPKKMIDIMFDSMCDVFANKYSREQFTEARTVYDELNKAIIKSMENIKH